LTILLNKAYQSVSFFRCFQNAEDQVTLEEKLLDKKIRIRPFGNVLDSWRISHPIGNLPHKISDSYFYYESQILALRYGSGPYYVERGNDSPYQRQEHRWRPLSLKTHISLDNEV
jgi:uncharacterized membrane-anchored protein